MKFSGLLIAVVVLAALGGAVWYSEKHPAAPDTKAATETAPKILTIPEDQFKEVRIAKTGADPMVVAKLADKWEITAPKPMPADQDSVNSMVSSLSSLSSDKLIDDKPTDLNPFGLNAPTEQITITKKDGKSQTLLLGKDSPVGSGVYAKLANDPRVFTLPSYAKSNLDKTPKDLRDKRLLTFNSDKLTRVELKGTGQPVEFGKNNQNEWQILKPKPLRADPLQVDELVRKLKDAKMDLSVSDEDAKKAQTAFASGTKVAVATVTDANGPQTLEVRKDKDKNYYAKSSAVEGIYKVTSDLGEGVAKGLDDFRNKKLFDFGFNDPGKIQLTSATYQKSGEKWMSGATQMDSTSVQGLIDKLRDLSATKFAEKDGGAAVFEATVTSADNKKTEKVTITKQGDTYYAVRQNEPSIYELDAKTVDELQKAAAAIKPFTAPKKK
jgi:hypothetical protein